MEGLFIKNKEEYLDRFDQKTGSLSLIGKGGGSEVMIQEVKANETVIVEPGDAGTFEFFYLVEGIIEFTIDGRVRKLETGDYFYTNQLAEVSEFVTVTDVKILYYTTQSFFSFISTTVRELMTLAEQVENKDLYTLGHIDRVKSYAQKIGRKLHLSNDHLETLYFAALIHDVGKVNVPDEILNKPDRLTEYEFEVIKKHPMGGAELVKETHYKKLATIIAQHHERVDGNGYPLGLKGEEIVIEARIILVADTFDAMTTDRPYRKALPVFVAVEELIKFSGIQFDSQVVKAFIEVLVDEGEVDQSILDQMRVVDRNVVLSSDQEKPFR